MRRWLIFPVMLLPFLIWYDCNFRIRVRTLELQHANIQNEIRIAHIGDLCGLNWGNDNRAIVELIAGHKPDLICITGDLYRPDDDSGRMIAEALIHSLRTIAPVFLSADGAYPGLSNEIAGLGNAMDRLFRPPEIRIIYLMAFIQQSRDAPAPRLLFYIFTRKQLSSGTQTNFCSSRYRMMYSLTIVASSFTVGQWRSAS